MAEAAADHGTAPAAKRFSLFGGSQHGPSNAAPAAAAAATKTDDGAGGPPAPIIDIKILMGNAAVPAGYIKIESTPDGKQADLNRASHGRTIFVCYKRGHDAPPVTAITVIFTDKGELPPAGPQQTPTTHDLPPAPPSPLSPDGSHRAAPGRTGAAV